MVNLINEKNNELDSQNNGDSHASVDYSWFAMRFEYLSDRLVALEEIISKNDPSDTTTREYYSVQEFATEVGRSKYTVREWCRFERIHAEKCDTGRGEAKCWKIPVEELGRYRDHGLLPVGYYSKD